ncbi:NADP-dependent oxidoreductase domain-containing protein [Ephemerocybe angulata]|uniref:NADP-dependent oxidoreductase domain-containing protein n=1 Tax=Ephemerocybe angulata TaxID=980116 RepID=A0A8H6MCC0_9AGAR|nr:NADP-dependent oxidoreductase domain-containing protein [Tulosesus angulatus]
MSPSTLTLNNGHQIPWMGFGTGSALFGRDATKLVVQAIQSGVTHLDGAQIYNNEDSLGLAIKESGKPRAELFITTKLKPPSAGQTVDVKASLKESLRKLQLDHVDLYLIHSPYPANTEGKLQDIWKQMEEVHEAGLATSIGVSNFRVEDLQDILKIAKVIPAVNQVELHPYVWDTARQIVEFDKQHGIRTASYGGLTPIVRAPGGPLDPVLETIRKRLEETRGSPVSTGQALTKWLLHKDAVVITTTTKASRIKEFQDTENVPELDEKEIQAIDDAGSKKHHRAFMHVVFGETR